MSAAPDISAITAETVEIETFTNLDGLAFTPDRYTMLASARARYQGYTQVVQLRGLGGCLSAARAGIVAFCKPGDHTPAWASILRADGSLTSGFLSIRSDGFAVS